MVVCLTVLFSCHLFIYCGTRVYLAKEICLERAEGFIVILLYHFYHYHLLELTGEIKSILQWMFTSIVEKGRES